MEHILDNNPDIVLLTETWLGSDKNSITAVIIRQYKLILNLYESTVPISHVIVQYVTLTEFSRMISRMISL